MAAIDDNNAILNLTVVDEVNTHSTTYIESFQLGAALEISLRKKSFQTLFFLTANL
jgi:hypothetical protein